MWAVRMKRFCRQVWMNLNLTRVAAFLRKVLRSGNSHADIFGDDVVGKYSRVFETNVSLRQRWRHALTHYLKGNDHEKEQKGTCSVRMTQLYRCRSNWLYTILIYIQWYSVILIFKSLSIIRLIRKLLNQFGLWCNYIWTVLPFWIRCNMPK